jgi:molybdopterin/thiamine biosynthesis adenylyltransferase
MMSAVAGERPDDERVTPISTPTDLFFEEDVSTSCADLNVIAPGAETVRSRVAVTLLPVTEMVKKRRKSQEVDTELIILFALASTQNLFRHISGGRGSVT